MGLERLLFLFKEIEPEYKKFMNGNATAGQRLRKHLMEITHISKELREDIQRLRYLRGDWTVRNWSKFEAKREQVLGNEAIYKPNHLEYIASKKRIAEKKRKAAEAQEQKTKDFYDTESMDFF